MLPGAWSVSLSVSLFNVDLWEPKLEKNNVEYCFVMVEN